MATILPDTRASFQCKGLMSPHLLFRCPVPVQSCVTHLVTCIYLPPCLSMVSKFMSMFFNFNFMYISVLCSTNVCALHLCLESVEAGKSVHFPGSRATESFESSYGCRDEMGSSGRAASTVTCWGISPAPTSFLFSSFSIVHYPTACSSTHLSTKGQLHCFWVWAIINKASTNSNTYILRE